MTTVFPTAETSTEPTSTPILELAKARLAQLGVDLPLGDDLPVVSPITGEHLFTLAATTPEGVADAVQRAHDAFKTWRRVPAPKRGEIVRQLGDKLRANKALLADLVTLETGKITSEAAGEVQEMIDICDYATGLSKQLWGKTIATERPEHRLAESWHPLGVVGVITAFNFPVAVWAWNTSVALTCGDTVIWKPSEAGNLSALAAKSLLDQVLRDNGYDPAISQIVLGARETGQVLVDHPKVALLSATGSVRMGREVGPRVQARFGRSLLELGGNNAAIVAPSANLDLAAHGIVFAAAGTAGQRCTSLRRLIVQRSVKDELLAKVTDAYRRLPIGDPREEGNLVGPLINRAALDKFTAAVDAAVAQGGKILVGGKRVEIDGLDGYYVEPAVIDMPAQEGIVLEETFAPILYVLTYDDFEEAVELNNSVSQGLSAAIFTQDMRESELFISSEGADTGIANVNIGTSGAEIGGAFGGEKETGGGRESGSDAWHAYMRMSTNTINYSTELPLAQGVKFLD